MRWREIAFGERHVKLLAATLVVCSFAACSQGYRSESGAVESSKPRSGIENTVANPLTSRIAKGATLTTINSLAITVPTLSSQASQSSLSPVEMQDMISRAAQEVMTLKVVLDKGSGRQGVSQGSRGGADSVAARALADGVLRTEVTQFKDRQGSAIGGEPATVSFKMTVVGSESGMPVWESQYFFRQEPLTENLLKLRDRIGSAGSGTGWISGHNLLKKGITAALEDFNKRREQQFLAAGR